MIVELTAQHTWFCRTADRQLNKVRFRSTKKENIMPCHQHSIPLGKLTQSAFFLLSAVVLGAFQVQAAEPRQPRSAVSVDFGDPPEQADSTAGILQVVATGVGIDEDTATQNAWSNAIEQAVGVMVDAETLVENDEIVSDKVLTFSRGFIEKFDVVRHWQADGLHHVRIWARVSPGKLAEKLADSKIATRRIPGELLYYQAMHSVAQAQAAADMLRKTLTDYTLDNLFEATIVGEPKQVSRDDVSATLSVTVHIAPNMQNWQKIYNTVTPVLQKVATKRTVFVGMRGVGDRADAIKRLAGEGILIRVMKSLSRTGLNATWDAYLVPESLVQALEETHDQPYKLSVDLVGEGDTLIARVDQRPFEGNAYLSQGDPSSFRCLGPCYSTSGSYYPDGTHCNIEVTMEIELAKLKQVTQCVAHIRDVSLDP
jgi:hypothetical protein